MWVWEERGEEGNTIKIHCMAFPIKWGGGEALKVKGKKIPPDNLCIVSYCHFCLSKCSISCMYSETIGLKS